MAKNMNKNLQKVKTGWEVPVTVKDDFVTFCAEKSTLAQEACAGALIIFQLLPAQIRELAMLEAKGKGLVDRKFWEDYRRGLEAAIEDRLRSPLDIPQIQKK